MFLRSTTTLLTLAALTVPAVADELNIYSYRQPELIAPWPRPSPRKPGSTSTSPTSNRAWWNG